MKKLVFTAVALMAFSATSMANTVEVKEVAIEETKEIKAKTCMKKALDAYEEYINTYQGGVDNFPLLQSFVKVCH